MFASNGSGRDVPEWRYTDEFSGGGSRVVGVVSPRSSVMGGARPSCYVAVAFSDGSVSFIMCESGEMLYLQVQCLLRDSLQQIESVELPRGGNLGWGGKRTCGIYGFLVAATKTKDKREFGKREI